MRSISSQRVILNSLGTLINVNRIFGIVEFELSRRSKTANLVFCFVLKSSGNLYELNLELGHVVKLDVKAI